MYIGAAAISDIKMDTRYQKASSSTSTMTDEDADKLQQESSHMDLEVNKPSKEVNYLNLSENTFEGRPKMLTYYSIPTKML